MLERTHVIVEISASLPGFLTCNALTNNQGDIEKKYFKKRSLRGEDEYASFKIII